MLFKNCFKHISKMVSVFFGVFFVLLVDNDCKSVNECKWMSKLKMYQTVCQNCCNTAVIKCLKKKLNFKSLSQVTSSGTILERSYRFYRIYRFNFFLFFLPRFSSVKLYIYYNSDWSKLFCFWNFFVSTVSPGTDCNTWQLIQLWCCSTTQTH